MKKNDILETALENFEAITQVRTKVNRKVPKNGYAWDALLHFDTGILKEKFKTEIKQTIQPTRLPELIQRLKKEEGLLVAKYISKPSREYLKNQGVNYLDIAGNCYIRTKSGLFLFVTGKKPTAALEETKHKAFNKNGIKLIFALLLEENIVNQPYRTIAKAANISVGSVGDILKDLKAAKFLFQKDKNTLVWNNKKNLLTKWVTAYNEKLKPKLLRGKFRFAAGKGDWQQLDLPPKTFWGGEPGGAILTKFLRPGKWTIYTNAERKALIKDLKIVPDPAGEIEIIEPFWNEHHFITDDAKTVPPLLVYADLLAGGNDRNFETANKIYEQHLQSIFE